MKDYDSMPSTRFNRMIGSVLAVLALAASGCGTGSGVELVQVEGVVTLDGRPVEGADVTFRPSVGRPSGGRTNSEGHYTLSYTREEKGAVAGEHQVSLSTYLEADDESPDPIRQKGRQESIPPKYNRKTTLTVQVEPGDVVVADFQLESK